MSINILTPVSHIFYSTNYNKLLSNQLNVFLKTNVQETPVTPFKKQIITKDMFQKEEIYQRRQFRVHSRFQSNR